MPVWDRLRGVQREDGGGGGAPTPSRQKLEAWQNARSQSPSPSLLFRAGGARGTGGGGGGIQGGNSQYSYAISSGPDPGPELRPGPGPGPGPGLGLKKKREAGGGGNINTTTTTTNSNNNNNKLVTAPRQSAKNPAYRDSDYGRPSGAANYAAQQLRREAYHHGDNDDDAVNDGVSPPSSPEASRPSHRDASDVSPIDEIPDMSQIPIPTTTAANSSSSIPTLRRERRKNSDAAAAALHRQKSTERLTAAAAAKANLKKPRPYGNDVRWDPDTGEPTTSDKGRPSQIDPREFVHGLGNRQTSSSQNVSPRHIKQAQQNQSAFGERVRRMRGGPDVETEPKFKSEPKPEPAPRPEWRGASGRAPLAQPLHDAPNAPPLKAPPRTEKRILSTLRGALNSATNTVSPRSVSTPVTRKPGAGEITHSSNNNHNNNGNDNNNGFVGNPSSTAAGQQRDSTPPAPANSDSKAEVHPETHRPRPPSDDHLHMRGANNSDAADPHHHHHHQQQQLHVPSNEKATKRKSIGAASTITTTTTTGHKSHPPDSQPSQQPKIVAPPAPTDDWVQPPSRFSITTYETSNHTASQRPSTDSEAPPLPAPYAAAGRPHTPSSPLHRPSSATSNNSIMERRRPIVAGYEKSPRLSPSDPVRISLAATYLSPAELKARPRPASSASSSASRQAEYAALSIRPVSQDSAAPRGGKGGGAEKDLPPAPPESDPATAGDAVARISARLQAVSNRRANVTTAIRQMTELMPEADGIYESAAVQKKREAERRKVAALRAELADLERDHHDLGLSLYRARKRADRDAEFEPTTLWVRRVTG